MVERVPEAPPDAAAPPPVLRPALLRAALTGLVFGPAWVVMDRQFGYSALELAAGGVFLGAFSAAAAGLVEGAARRAGPAGRALGVAGALLAAAAGAAAGELQVRYLVSMAGAARVEGAWGDVEATLGALLTPRFLGLALAWAVPFAAASGARLAGAQRLGVQWAVTVALALGAALLAVPALGLRTFPGREAFSDLLGPRMVLAAVALPLVARWVDRIEGAFGRRRDPETA